VEFTDSDKNSSLPRTIKTVAFSYSGVYKSQYLLWGKESPRVWIVDIDKHASLLWNRTNCCWKSNMIQGTI